MGETLPTAGARNPSTSGAPGGLSKLAPPGGAMDFHPSCLKERHHDTNDGGGDQGDDVLHRCLHTRSGFPPPATPLPGDGAGERAEVVAAIARWSLPPERCWPQAQCRSRADRVPTPWWLQPEL